MKRKSILPLVFIFAGAVFIGLGGWQMIHSAMQTKETLGKAKQIVENRVNPIGNREKDKPAAIGDTVGILVIPRVNAELPIVEGTDANDLAKGVGHYEGSSLPGEQGQIVLSGHRDTVFRRLGELKIGDSLIVKIARGSYTYQITRMKIVDDTDKNIITLQKKEEELILTTCYPFRYIGNAPKRYIIYAKPKSP